MKQPFFKTGLVLLVVLLPAHLYNNRNGLPIPVVDHDSSVLTNLMRSYYINFFGSYRTLNETIWGYDLTWALFVIFAILITWYGYTKRYNSPRTAKYIAFANMLLWLGALISALIFWSAPQQILFGALFIAFALSYFFDWKAARPKDTRVCIIGAGISGLTAAYQLQKQGYRHITVLEKETQIGGKCLTSDLDEQPFDLGGHEMLAGYKDLLTIANELNAPTRLSIPPLVYDKNKRQYLNFKEAATISGKYTLTQVMVASLKYLWLVTFKFRQFSQPGTGYKNIPQELTMRLDDWLKKRKLEALTDILGFVIKVQGYGQFTDESAAHLVKFMGFQNWLSLILSGVGLSKKWPRVMVCGMNNLCERMANTLFDVRVGIDVQRIIREPSRTTGGVQVFWEKVSGVSLDEDNNPMVFDKLIISTPLEPIDIGFLDITKEEQALFAGIEHYRFFTTVAKVEGLPAGVVASIPFNDIALGEYSGYIKDFGEVPIASFFTLALDEKIDGRKAKLGINAVLAGLPPYDNKQPRVIDFVEQKEWRYFPHFSVASVANGAYDQLEALQGKNNTWYASSLLSFECVGNSAAYAKRLVTTHF